MSKQTRNQNQWARTRAQTKDRQRRHRRRFRSYILQILFGTIIVTVLFFTLSLTVFFNINEIIITGDDGYTAEDFAAATGLELGDNLFRINTESLEQKVLEQSVEIDDVSISRQFPNALKVKLTPAEAACACYYNGQYYYVSQSGRLMDVSSVFSEDSDIILIGGIDLSHFQEGDFVEDSEEYRPMLRLVQATKKYNFDSVTAVSFSEIGEITFCYNDQITVQLGTAVELEYKLQIVQKVIEEYVQGQEGVIDAQTISKAYFRPMTMEVQEENGLVVKVGPDADSSAAADDQGDTDDGQQDTGTDDADDTTDGADDASEDGTLADVSTEDGTYA